jgi:hypothetical protein
MLTTAGAVTAAAAPLPDPPEDGELDGPELEHAATATAATARRAAVRGANIIRSPSRLMEDS